MSRSALEALAELHRRREARPLDYMRWLKFQADIFRNSHHKRLLARAGNQALGKSTAGIALLIWRCLGKGPANLDLPVFQTPPISALVVATIHKQSLEIQRKIYALLPKEEVDWTKTIYDEKNGFGANNPTVIFKNGSRIRIATDEQGPRAIQGGTYHYAWIDELCSPEMWREVERRVLTTSGSIFVSATPINAPAGWLKELVEAGSVQEVHGKLTVENLCYDGTTEVRQLSDGTHLDQSWIDAQWQSVAPMWAQILLDGEWMGKASGAFFADAWDAASLVSDRATFDGSSSEIRYHLGIDYATADRPEGLVAVLVAVQQSKPDPAKPPVQHVIVEDLVVLPGSATMSMFATDILSMLGRAGLRWRDLASVYGDNPVSSRFEFKSNLDLSKKLAHELRLPVTGLQPRILAAKEQTRSSGSRDAGCRYLYELMASKRIIVRPRCQSLIEAIEQWDYTPMHRAKDRVDALRYSLKDYIFSSSNPHSGVRIRVG